MAEVGDLKLKANPSIVPTNSDSYLSWSYPTATNCVVQLYGFSIFGGTVGANVRTDGATGGVVGPWGHLVNDVEYTLYCWFPSDSRWHFGKARVLVETQPQPNLNDLFSGIARFETNQTQRIALTFSNTQPAWEQKKLSIIKNHQDGKYYAFTRKFVERPWGATFTIALLRSDDAGLSFIEVGEIFSPSTHQQLYDPHVSIDTTQSPPRYVMVMECNADTVEHLTDLKLEWASTCLSTSTNPFSISDWTPPTVLIEGCDDNPTTGCTSAVTHSASTPAALFNGSDKFVSWTAVEDNGTASRARSEGYYYFPGSRIPANWSYVLMDASPQLFCTSWWDCNNRDKQDWKAEGGDYFLVYDGSNYYRCEDGNWGISIARSTTGPFGAYLQLPLPIFLSPNAGCNLAYPTLIRS